MSASNREPGTSGRWLDVLRAKPRPSESLRIDGHGFSFGEMVDAVEAANETTAALEIEAGSRVALLAAPSAAGVVLIHSLLDSLLVMAPLNLRLTEPEWIIALEQSHADWLVVSADFRDAGIRLAEAVGCGVLELIDDCEGLKLEWTLLRAPQEKIEEDAEERALREWIRIYRGALVLLTSGTSGRPKAALLSEDNLRASADASIARLGSSSDDRWLCCMPLFHVGGLSILIRSALCGTCVVLHRRFDAEAVSQALDDERVTKMSVVAAMLSRILEVRDGRRAPQSLTCVLLGGGPASAELLSRAESLGYPLALTYGLTEAASQVATRAPRAVSAGEGTGLRLGLPPMPGTEIRIVGEDGGQRPTGDVGEIEVRGPTVMIGYLGDPVATRNAIRDGWLATGDLGRLDASGAVTILDRRSDLILSGGENVYPAEVEAALVDHPFVVEAAVVGVADDAYGARPIAYVVLEGGDIASKIDGQALIEYCRNRLASFKVPKEIRVIESLPRTVSGKLLRRSLREGSASSV